MIIMKLLEYKNHMLRRKLREATIQDYLISLNVVEKFLGKPLESATKKDIERFLDFSSSKSANTIIARMRALKLYFKWLGKPEITDFPLPKKPSNNLVSSDLLTEEEILRLINACDNLRDKAILSLLFDSACRRGEIINLNIENVFLESDKTGYIVVDGKTGKRQVPLSFSIPALREWLNSHPLKDKPSSPLFISFKQCFGNRLSVDAILQALRKYSKRAEIKKRVFCHLFRHTRLTELDKKGLSHTAMKNFAGWSRNSNMPSVYSHFSAQDTKDLIYEADGITQPKIRKKTILEPVNCPNCKTPNDKTNRYCFLCGMALDENSRNEFEIQELVKLLIKTKPEVAKAVSEGLASLKP